MSTKDADDDPRVGIVEDAFFKAAKEDWRAALAWLAHHPQTRERYKQKSVNWRFSWDTDE